MPKPILCLDFDGVIHSYISGWKGASVIPDPPVDGALEFIASAMEIFDIAIFSSRSNQLGGIEAMREWLIKYGGGSLIEFINFPIEKPSAFVTLDDRAITFNGIWPSASELREFKPWYKR